MTCESVKVIYLYLQRLSYFLLPVLIKLLSGLINGDDIDKACYKIKGRYVELASNKYSKGD
jgi:hypothetical protein